MAKTLIGNIKGPKGDKGDKGDKGVQGSAGAAGQRGSNWFRGTGITGTSTTATVFSGSGVTSALVNDMYLNTSTGNVYTCTTAGAASTAKWVYTGNLKGVKGDTGAKGDKGDIGAKGDKGDKGDTGPMPTVADALTTTFTQASSRTNIASGETNKTIMGKIKKWFADMTVAAFAQVISNNTDLMANTVAGYLPDALAVKQQFDVVNSNLKKINLAYSNSVQFLLTEGGMNITLLGDDVSWQVAFMPGQIALYKKVSGGSWEQIWSK